jgi:hypothetical protein
LSHYYANITPLILAITHYAFIAATLIADITPLRHYYITPLIIELIDIIDAITPAGFLLFSVI